MRKLIDNNVYGNTYAFNWNKKIDCGSVFIQKNSASYMCAYLCMSAKCLYSKICVYGHKSTYVYCHEFIKIIYFSIFKITIFNYTLHTYLHAYNIYPTLYCLYRYLNLTISLTLSELQIGLHI